MTHDVFDWTQEWARLRGLRHWTSEETASTNSFAKQDETVAPLAPALGPVSGPSLYLAKSQSAGRGRGEHHWENSDGALLSSWSFRCTTAPQPIFAPLVGLALFEALGSIFSGLRLSIKAPNDVFSNDKKIAGVLIETVVTGSDVKTVVGLGLNVQAGPPSLSTAGAIGDSAHIDRSLWLGFLDAWNAKLVQATTDGLQTTLHESARARLRDALNTHPLRRDRVIRVGAMGEIETLKGFVHWHQL